MLRKTKQTFGQAPSATYNGEPVTTTAGMPMDYNMLPQNVYKEIGGGPMNKLDVTDPFARMAPSNIPVPGTSVWTNPDGGSKLGSTGDMLGLISSFDKHQRNTINPLELYACQNEGPSVLHYEVQPIYEGCRRLILNGKMDIGFCQYKNKIINFGRLFLDKDRYLFPYPYRGGYKKQDIVVFLVKFRSPNIILQFEPIVEFDNEMFRVGQFCKSSSVVMNYFWIAWAYSKNKDDMVIDFKI